MRVDPQHLDRALEHWNAQRVIYTTVVETDIHYPTDSSLLSDGVRVLTSSMQR